MIEGEWGSGKSHLAALCRSVLARKHLAWVQSSVDGKGASLSHVNRCVPSWMAQIRIGEVSGLRAAIEQEHLLPDSVVAWSERNPCELGVGLRSALAGFEAGWLRALGHMFAMPDSSRQRDKAIQALIDTSRLLREVWGGRVVLLLDEVENISREWDVRGRRRAYDTLAALAECTEIQLILFVTPRLIEQVMVDYERSRKEFEWSIRSSRFLQLILTSDRLAIPRLSLQQAIELIERICEVAGFAAGANIRLRGAAVERLCAAWESTATRSTRLLVRMTVQECDLEFGRTHGALGSDIRTAHLDVRAEA